MIEAVEDHARVTSPRMMSADGDQDASSFYRRPRFVRHASTSSVSRPSVSRLFTHPS